MQFHRQINRHVPESGQIGDCFRTCIACFMNLSPEDVPNFMDSETMLEVEMQTQRWLGDRGLTLVDLPFTDTIENITEIMAKINGNDFCYMVSGMGMVAGHVVIYRGRELLWDPNGGSGLTGPIDGNYWVKFLASLRCRFSGEIQ